MMALAVTAGPAAAEPLGSWSLDEGAGQLAADSTGLGHDGQLGASSGSDGHDPAWATGRFGSGLRFDGAQDQYVTLSSPAALRPHHVTVDAWVRRLGTPGTWRYVVSSGAMSCEFASYGLYTGFNGGLAFYVSDDEGFVRSPELAQNAVWDGAWHRAVGTYDGERVRLYVDGVELGAGTPTQLSIAYGSPAAFIGTYHGSCERPFTGDVDEVAIHRRALSAVEVGRDAAEDAKKPVPPQSPPVSGPPAVAPKPAPRACLSLRVTPKKLVARRRSRVRVSVRRSGLPVAGQRISIRGLGLTRRGRTNTRGRVRLAIRPARSGRLRVSAIGQPRRCTTRVTVSRRR